MITIWYMQSFFNTTYIKILSALVLFMAIVALASYASLNFERLAYVDPMPPTISVSGEGEVLAVPDVAQFSFTVTAEAPEANAAQSESAERVNAIIDYLTEQGIEARDIKTERYDLNPRWRYEDRVCPAGSYCPPGERVQDGFSVSQRISVKVRDTDLAGTLLAGVGERGATNISRLEFTVDDQEALRAEARAAAIADAREKAQALAADLGVSLLQLQGYHEEQGGYFSPRMMAMDEAAGLGGGTAPELPVGEEETTVRVNLTYRVR